MNQYYVVCPKCRTYVPQLKVVEGLGIIVVKGGLGFEIDPQGSTALSCAFPDCGQTILTTNANTVVYFAFDKAGLDKKNRPIIYKRISYFGEGSADTTPSQPVTQPRKETGGG